MRKAQAKTGIIDKFAVLFLEEQTGSEQHGMFKIDYGFKLSFLDMPKEPEKEKDNDNEV